MTSIVELMILVVLVALARARCPEGWSVNGIRPDGSYECLSPIPRGCGEPVGDSPPCPPTTLSRGRIYCTGGSVPIVVDNRTVGCQARH
jgi:hypothetical protein